MTEENKEVDETKITVDTSTGNEQITVSTIEERIDDYFDEKRMMVAEKIGDALDNFDEDAGSAAMVYIMSGQMLRSCVALMCFEASGGEGSNADDVAAIIEAASALSSAREDLINHDYAKDINDGIRSVTETPGAIMRGDFGFIGNAINAVTGSPKAVVDGINLAKSAVGSTVAEVWRGDYTKDSAYITYLKTGNGLAMSTACRAGSEKAGNEECVELCYLYGRNLAVAYNIAEDMCKMADCANLGVLDEDITLAMAYALDQCGTNAFIGDVDSKALFRELRKDNNIEDAKLRLAIAYNKYTKAAVNAAKLLPDGIYRDMLIALPNHLFVELREEYNIEKAF